MQPTIQLGDWTAYSYGLFVLLGWLVAGESLTPRILLASAVIVGAVALIVTFGAAGPPSRSPIKTDEYPIASTDAA